MPDWRLMTRRRSIVLLPIVLSLSSPAASSENYLSQPRVDRGEIVRTAINSGSYQEAEALARQWAAQAEAESGEASPEVLRAQDFLVEARIGNGRCAEVETLALAKRIVAAKVGHRASEELSLASSLRNLGLVLAERGEFDAALRIEERALTIRRQRLPEEDSQLADSLDDVAMCLISLERFSEARERLRAALVVRDLHADTEPLALARTLQFLALLERNEAAYPAGRCLRWNGQSRSSGAPLMSIRILCSRYDFVAKFWP